METQVTQSQVINAYSLLNVLQCPQCGSTSFNESQSESTIDCQNCHTQFPVLLFSDIRIPLLFSDPHTAIFDWSARVNGFTRKVTQEIEDIANQLKSKTISKLTRDRLKYLLKAKKQYQTQLLDHLQCLQNFQFDDTLLSSTSLAKNQGVDSYINNIFRDWCWENGENQELLHAIENVLDDSFDAGLCVTLGAGAGRLSYDFHRVYKAKHSVLVDINPVLLGCAAKIFNKQSVVLNEFPVAPLKSADYSVEQICRHDELINQDEFTFLLADGLNAPIQSKSVDTVITPWFIDIIPIDLKDFIPHVNRLLNIGGTWINTGSLAFFHSNEQWNYSEDEVIDLLKKFGFDNINVSRMKINYLNSPHSAHGRVENVFSFSARKKFESVSARTSHYLPQWVENTTQAIPQLPNLVAISSKYLLQAQVLSAIDGNRSVADIGKLLAKQYAMPEQEAIAAVRKILIDNL